MALTQLLQLDPAWFITCVHHLYWSESSVDLGQVFTGWMDTR